MPPAALTTLSSLSRWWRAPGPAWALRYVAALFAVLAIAMAVTLWALDHAWGFALPTDLVWITTLVQGSLVLPCLWFAQRREVSEGTILTGMLGTVILMSGFLFASGGHTNPLISLLLLPLALSAALLTWQSSLLLSVVALLAWSWLTQHFLPLGSDDANGHQKVMRMHLLGMWLTFGMSVAVIIGLIAPMAASMRRQRDLIAQQRETMLRDERLVALATFAASAAHQLGTPLATLSLLVEEVQASCADRTDLASDIAEMHHQVALCKHTLQAMMRKADSVRLGVTRPEPVAGFLQRMREQFTLLHPARTPTLTALLPDDEWIHCDETLEQALLNLLDNAAKADAQPPQLTVTLEQEQLCLRITDQGPGLPADIRARFGEPFLTSGTGLGLGLFLSNASIQRLGGTLTIRRDAGGNHAEIRLPRTRGEIA